MIANYQATFFLPHVRHITDEAVRRIGEREPRSRVFEAYSHVGHRDGILGGPNGKQEVSFNLHITGESDGKHTLTLKVTEGGIRYTADEGVVVRVFDDINREETEGLNILEGPIAQNTGVLHERQLLAAVPSGNMQSAEGLVYAAAYVKES